MKRNLLFYLYFCVFFVLMSCSECLQDELVIEKEIKKENVLSQTESYMIRFSEILSKAATDDSDLRSFLKAEALSMVNNDYDIFYPYSKSKIVSNGKSFRDILISYAKNEEELLSIEQSLPLLTIYVPELPSGFDANSWDSENEIPYVVSNLLRNDSVDFYYDGTPAFSLKSYEIPGCATLVIKNNERIRLKDKSTTSVGLRSSSSDYEYEFIDEAFNGQSTLMRSVTLPTGLFPQTVTQAFNEMGINNNYWQRDYIYYGLTKQSGNTGFGYLNRRFSEAIRYIKFTPDAYYKMSDQSNDPKWKLYLEQSANPNPNVGNLLWTEGRFEIRIDVFVNNLTGFGSSLTKYFSVSPQEIFDIQYTTYKTAFFYNYIPTDITSKQYAVNIDLITWDLESNSFGWKFLISEVDDQTTETYTTTVNAEYATNFGLTASGIIGKIGLNFGVSAKKSQTNNYTMVTNKGSDDLGSIEFSFSDPVLVNYNANQMFTLFSKSNPYVEMILCPRQIY